MNEPGSVRKDILEETLREAVKDLLITRPFARGERLDSVSASILSTIGMILTIFLGITTLILQKPAPTWMKVLIVLPCATLILSIVSLILSIRSREVLIPSEISVEIYFRFLEDLSRVNDYKKKLQNMGLALLIIGIVLMVTVFVMIIL